MIGSKSRTFYEDKSDGTSQPSRADEIRRKAMVSLIPPGQTGLGVGCGGGWFSEPLLGRNQVRGCDISSKELAGAEAKGIVASLIDLENDGLSFYESESFDNVLAAEIIEHLLDTDAFPEDVRRVLKPGGYLILSTPNVVSLGKRIMFLFDKNVGSDPFMRKPWAGHLRYYTKQSLVDLLEYHHLEISKFTSDHICFTNNGSRGSAMLARAFPTLGRALIVQCREIA